MNHTSVVLPDVPELDVHIYAYTGTVDGSDSLGLHPKAEKPVELHVQCIEIDGWAERLYYDLTVPADVLRFSDSKTHTYAAIMEHLNNALNLLQWHSEDALRLASSQEGKLVGSCFLLTEKISSMKMPSQVS